MKIIILTILIISSLFSASGYIPKNFYTNKDSLKEITGEYIALDESDSFTSLEYTTYFGALIEHESCITLTHSRCWSPTAQLLTKWPNGKIREQGVGLGQITRAYRESGAVRLDVLTDLRKRYPKQLSTLTWYNIKEKPKLQIAAITLLWLDNYNRLPNHISELDKIAFSDSAYNGGYGYVVKDRKLCGLKANCDPSLWFDNVEKINSRGSKTLYGNRTANQINRDHVRDVLFSRWGKYYTVNWN